MKRKVFLILGVVAIATAVMFKVNMDLRDDSISNLALANIEALAQSEGGDMFNDCASVGYWYCGYLAFYTDYYSPPSVYAVYTKTW